MSRNHMMRIGDYIPFNSNRKSKRFYKVLWSYISIIIIMLVVLSIIVYNNFIIILQDEIRNSNLSKLEYTSSYLDVRIQELNKIAVDISNNYVFSYFPYMDDGYSNFQCIRELKKYVGTNTFIMDALLYYPIRNSDKIYSMNGVYDIDTLFSKIYNYENWSQREFTETISSLRSMYVRPSENIVMSESRKGTAATIVFPIPVNSSKPKLAVMFLIEDKVLADILSNMMGNNRGLVYILDKNNQIISYSTLGDMLKEPEDYISNINIDTVDNNELLTTSDGEKLLITKVTSKNIEWSFVSLINTDQIYDKVEKARLIFVYTILTLFLVGCVLSFRQANKQYKGLRHIVDAIGKMKIRKEQEQITDEIAFISRTIEMVSHENQDLNKKLEKSMKDARNQYLLSFLNEGIAVNSIQKNISQILNVYLADNYSVASMIFIHEEEESIKEQNVNIETDRVSLIQGLIEKHISEVGYGYTVNMTIDGWIAVIVQVKNEIANNAVLCNVANRIRDEYKNTYQGVLTVGIGRIYDCIDKVPLSFAQAKESITYRLVKGFGEILLFDELETQKNMSYSYPVELETEILKAIKSGDMDMIEEKVSNLLMNFKQCNVTPNIVKNVYYGIINSIIKMTIELNIKDNNYVQIEIYNVIVNTTFDSLENLGESLKKLCINIMYLLEEYKDTDNIAIINYIVEYIHDNYKNNTLTMDEIASKAGKSISFIRQKFKEQIGCPIMQYLDIYRLEKTKEMLKDTEMTLDEILDNVGYVDKNNFIRKFRKNEGVTPIEYRNISNMCDKI